MISRIAPMPTTGPTTAPAIQVWLVEAGVEDALPMSVLEELALLVAVLDGVVDGAYDELAKII
jgi:hypothetical protein